MNTESGEDLGPVGMKAAKKVQDELTVSGLRDCGGS